MNINSSTGASRVGYAVLVNNRGIGKPDPVDAIASHGMPYGAQRDPHSGLADSSIELSLYTLDKQDGVKLKKAFPPGKNFSTYA